MIEFDLTDRAFDTETAPPLGKMLVKVEVELPANGQSLHVDSARSRSVC